MVHIIPILLINPCIDAQNEIAPKGAGIARVKGFHILFNDTMSGDHITVKITKTDPLSAEAEIITWNSSDKLNMR